MDGGEAFAVAGKFLTGGWESNTLKKEGEECTTHVNQAN